MDLEIWLHVGNVLSISQHLHKIVNCVKFIPNFYHLKSNSSFFWQLDPKKIGITGNLKAQVYML